MVKLIYKFFYKKIDLYNKKYTTSWKYVYIKIYQSKVSVQRVYYWTGEGHASSWKAGRANCLAWTVYHQEVHLFFLFLCTEILIFQNLNLLLGSITGLFRLACWNRTKSVGTGRYLSLVWKTAPDTLYRISIATLDSAQQCLL